MIDSSWVRITMRLFKTTIIVVEYTFPKIPMVDEKYNGWPGSKNKIKLIIAMVAVTKFTLEPKKKKKRKVK